MSSFSGALTVGGKGSGVSQRAGVAVVAAVAILFAAASPAFGQDKQMSGFIGGPEGSTVGHVGGSFQGPTGTVVFEGTDSDPATDKIFVLDGASSPSRRVQRLDRFGNFERAWGKDVAQGGGTGPEVCTVASACKAGEQGDGGGEFNAPSGLAVDQVNGWAYVLDLGNHRIQKFDLDGTFIAAFGANVNQTAVDASAPQVDRDLCTAASGDQCVAGTAGDGAGALGLTGGAAQTLAWSKLTVSPSSGDVLVADGTNRRVLQFDSAGAFVAGWGYGVDSGGAVFEACTRASGCQSGSASGGSANGQFGAADPREIAVDSQGVVYASDTNSSNRVMRFDASGVVAPGDATGRLGSAVATDPAGPLLTARTGGLSVLGTWSLSVQGDPDGVGPLGESLLVARWPVAQSMQVQQLDISGGIGADVDTEAARHEFADQRISGTIGSSVATGRLYLPVSLSAVSQFPACGGCVGVVVLSDEGSVDPVFGVSPAADVEATTALLGGTVSTDGGMVSARLEFSRSGLPDDWHQVGETGYVADDGLLELEGTATGLDPATVYRVRLAAERYVSLTDKETFVSGEQTFLTDSAVPDVITLPVGPRTSSSAVLRGTVDPNGTATGYRFEWGPAGGSFDHHIPVPDGLAGNGNTPVQVSVSISGLLPETGYQYRLRAISTAGPAQHGDTIAFQTQPTPGPPTSDSARTYELVSPADKIGGAGAGTWYVGPGSLGSIGLAAYDGERFAVHATFGSMLLDGAQAYANDWAFADRRGDQAGWVSRSPFVHPSAGSAFAQYLYPHVTTPSLSRVGWGTNNVTPKMFPEMVGGAEPYSDIQARFVSSWGDLGVPVRWELFGPTDPASQLTVLPSTAARATETVLAADGSSALGVTAMSPAGVSLVVGLAGDGDPSNPVHGGLAGDLAAGRLIYAADTSGPLADSFAGTGPREVVNVCTGEPGVDRTVLPAADGAGNIAGVECGPVAPGRDSRLVSDLGAALKYGDTGASGGDAGSIAGTVSGDGSRVFFMAPDPAATGVPDGVSGFCAAPGEVCPTQLFVRARRPDGSVVVRWVSRPVDPALVGAQDASLLGTTRFEGASADGRRMFFRSNSPLTADDPNGDCGAPCLVGIPDNDSWDLFMYELPADPMADPADGTLTRISRGPTGGSDCNSPLPGEEVGALRFASRDGGRVYFVCAAPLTGVAPAQNGTTALPGGDVTDSTAANLYLYDHNHTSGDRWRFITRLPRSPLGCAASGVNGMGALVSRPITGNIATGGQSRCVWGTDDAAFVTFLSTGSLTAGVPVGQGAVSLFGYDADADELSRLSEPQGGVGGSWPCEVPAGGLSCFAHGALDFDDNRGRAGSPSLGVVADPERPGDRVAFFTSRSRLVPGDVDDAYDVYQWRNGVLSLVSTGASSTDGALYAGNDRSGRNVYFASRDRLSWQDFDAVADVYSARVGQGVSEPPAPPVCGVLGDGCQGPGVGSPAAGAIVSGAPGGSGNVDPGAGEGEGEGRRARVVLRRAGRRVVRRAGRTGRLAVVVASRPAGRVRLVARARIGRRVRPVARGMVVARPKARVVRLRLARPARVVLRRGQRLRVAVAAKRRGADRRSVRLLVRGGRR